MSVNSLQSIGQSQKPIIEGELLKVFADDVEGDSNQAEFQFLKKT